MSADFTPEKEDYGVLSPFKMQVLTNFPYIEADFDALTNYQLLCKVVEYLNNVIANENEVTEQVTSLYNAYVSLQNYVNTYFDTLDLQTLVDNKLDEMAVDGTLADMIAEYIRMQGQLVYNSVADMKAAENIQNGSFLKTYGYYSYNDGGGALYKARTITNEDIIDNCTIIALKDITLIAELIINNEMNIKQFGAYEDGIHDDTLFIQRALNKVKKLQFNNKNYLIDQVVKDQEINNYSLLIPNNIIINGNNAKLIAKTNDLPYYSMLRVESENVLINDFNLIGDRETHIIESGTHEFGMGISILNTANNVKINNCTIEKTTGDCIYIDTTDNTNNPTNIYIKNCILNNSRRQGLSICAGINIYLNDSIIKNISGTNPQSGIDIEPVSHTIENINLTNITIENCVRGLIITTALNTINDVININNCKLINNVLIINNLCSHNNINISNIYMFGSSDISLQANGENSYININGILDHYKRINNTRSIIAFSSSNLYNINLDLAIYEDSESSVSDDSTVFGLESGTVPNFNNCNIFVHGVLKETYRYLNPSNLPLIFISDNIKTITDESTSKDKLSYQLIHKHIINNQTAEGACLQYYGSAFPNEKIINTPIIIDNLSSARTIVTILGTNNFLDANSRYIYRITGTYRLEEITHYTLT